MKLSKQEYVDGRRKCRLKAFEDYFSNYDYSEHEKKTIMRCIEQNSRFDRQYYNLITTGNILCGTVAELLKVYHNAFRLPVIREYLEMFLEDVGREVINDLYASFLREKGVKRLEDLVTFPK